MSQYSKVNSELRTDILEIVARNPEIDNATLQIYVEAGFRSLRSIQEATQKLTNEGSLVRVNGGFSLPVPTAQPSEVSVG